MRTLVFVATVLAAGCASSYQGSQVRDTYGRPLPTYALVDAPAETLDVSCHGMTYHVISPLTRRERQLDIERQPRHLDAQATAAMCARIAVADR
jgi:hypothetical protein